MNQTVTISATYLRMLAQLVAPQPCLRPQLQAVMLREVGGQLVAAASDGTAGAVVCEGLPAPANFWIDLDRKAFAIPAKALSVDVTVQDQGLCTVVAHLPSPAKPWVHAFARHEHRADSPRDNIAARLLELNRQADCPSTAPSSCAHHHLQIRATEYIKIVAAARIASDRASANSRIRFISGGGKNMARFCIQGAEHLFGVVATQPDMMYSAVPSAFKLDEPAGLGDSLTLASTDFEWLHGLMKAFGCSKRPAPAYIFEHSGKAVLATGSMRSGAMMATSKPAPAGFALKLADDLVWEIGLQRQLEQLEFRRQPCGSCMLVTTSGKLDRTWLDHVAAHQVRAHVLGDLKEIAEDSHVLCEDVALFERLVPSLSATRGSGYLIWHGRGPWRKTFFTVKNNDKFIGWATPYAPVAQPEPLPASLPGALPDNTSDSALRSVERPAVENA